MALLGQALIQYYGLDLLFSGDFDGVSRWIIETAGGYLVGDALAAPFADAVFQWPVVPDPLDPLYWA